MFKRLIHLSKTCLLLFKLLLAKTSAAHHLAKVVLAEQLASGRGLPMKIGQVLAGMGDGHVFKDLTQSVAPWKLQDIKLILEQAWGKPLNQQLNFIEESRAAASLGQVHRAELITGETVAIKVQYPDIQQAIQTELMLIKLMPKAGPVKRWDFDFKAYKNTLKKNMDNELNYELEMKQQQQFHKLIDVEGLNIPSIYPDLCQKNILVQSWVNGERLSAVARSWNKTQRLGIAKTLMQTMFQSLFRHGLIHGDPHPGNLLFERSKSTTTVHLLDYGCMVHVAKRRRLVLLQLILSCRNKLHIDPLEGFVALGFNAVKLQPIQAKLPALMQIIFRPFLVDKPFDLTQWSLSKEADVLLGQQKWLFRAAGPADLFLLMRIFQGLAQQLTTLQSQLPWWPILKQALPDNFLQNVQQQKLVKTVILPEFHGSAQKLNIEIFNDEDPYINFSLPASCALELESLMPEEAIAIIHQQGINLAKVTQELQSKGIHPSVIFDVKSNHKRYRISLT